MTDSSQELAFTRIFDAPPALVFRAFTEPELVPRWFVAPDETLVVETLDARAGGSWKFVNTEADGSTNSFHGVFHAVDPDRIVQTFEYGGIPGTVLLETVTLEDLGDGRTKLSDSMVFPSVDARAAMGGGGGAQETMDRLEKLLRTL
jgi:uncharacterized protein YndB with AHSA1/START domain